MVNMFANTERWTNGHFFHRSEGHMSRYAFYGIYWDTRLSLNRAWMKDTIPINLDVMIDQFTSFCISYQSCTALNTAATDR